MSNRMRNVHMQSYQMFQRQEILHQKPSQLIGYKLSCRCRKLTLSAKEYPNAYKEEKPLSMKLIFLHMSEAYYVNT